MRTRNEGAGFSPEEEMFYAYHNFHPHLAIGREKGLNE
jgi:hypothetical protein